MTVNVKTANPRRQTDLELMEDWKGYIHGSELGSLTVTFKFMCIRHLRAVFKCVHHRRMYVELELLCPHITRVGTQSEIKNGSMATGSEELHR